MQGPASPPNHWFEDLYLPSWLIVVSVQQGQATQETVSDSQCRVIPWRRSWRRVALTCSLSILNADGVSVKLTSNFLVHPNSDHFQYQLRNLSRGMLVDLMASMIG